MGTQRSEQHPTTTTMKVAIVLLLATMAYARPAELEEETAEILRSDAPAEQEEESTELLRSDVAHPDEDGAHSMSFAVDNGIQFELSGREGEEGGSNMVGSFTYIVDGEAVPLTFVADKNGYQPDSSLLPVAPAFPHEIPQFVLDQIAFAEQERLAQSEEK